MTKACLPLSVWLVLTAGVSDTRGQSAPPAAQAPAGPQTAQPAPSYPTVRVGVVSYLQYDAELQNRESYNGFDVTRGYLNVTGNLSPRLSYRITPDIKRAGDGSLAGSLVLRIKYAFAQLRGPAAGSWLRLGAHQTPWLDFEEHVNRYRVQGTMFSEREGLIPGSSDFGIGYLTPLPSDLGEVQAGLYNGEGYAKTEATRHKSVQGRLSLRPFRSGELSRGFRLNTFYNLGWYAAGRPRRLGIVMGSYEHSRLAATAQWLAATEQPVAGVAETDRRGYSTFLEIRQGLTGWAGLVRVENLDPDTSRRDDDHRRIIAGGAYWWRPSNTTVGLVLTVEDVRYGAAAGAADETRVLAQTHIEF